MKNDYITRTIQAYDTSPDKYASTTNEMINTDELDKLVAMLTDTAHPILDVGCAYGRDSAILTEKGYDTVGIDMSRELLKRAESAYPSLNFTYMDVRHLEFADNSFTGAWCNAVLLHLNDQDLPTALAEIRRVLQPGGVIAASFKEGVGSKEVDETFTSDLSRFYNFQTERTVVDLFKSSGLKVRESYVLNERERFGPDKRDLNWIWCFATKE